MPSSKLRTIAQLIALQLVVFVLPSVTPSVYAHSVKPRFGGYKDNQGLQRQRIGFDGAIELSAGGDWLTNHSYNATMNRDIFRIDDLSENKYQNEVYGSATRTQDTVSLTATQTWKKITDTRVLVNQSTDGKQSSTTAGVGASHWFAGESWQVSLDLSRTKTERPEFAILDYDSEIVSPPTDAASNGTTVGIRNLTTPTTITLASVTEIRATDRPVTRIGTVGVRQYVVPLSGAAHVTATRAYNRGRVTTDTTYGEVDAWQADLAWLQSLWKGATARLAYRWYREDETTRAYGDELVYGSDMVTMGFAQEWNAERSRTPITAEVSSTRYASNTDVNAGALEFALGARF